MSKNTYTPQYYYLDQLYISEIVIDETENLSIFGYLYDEESKNLTRWDFFSTFDHLTDILLLAKDEGETIIKILSETIATEFDIPTIIGVESLFGKPLYVDSFILKVYKPHEKNEDGNWRPMEEKCLYIDKVETTETFQLLEPNKDIATVRNDEIIGDLLDEALYNMNTEENKDPENNLDYYLALLDRAYKYYFSLLNKFSEKKARKLAGLKNELFFKIAYYNNQTRTNQ